MTAEKMHAIAPDLLAAAEDIANASGAVPLFDRRHRSARRSAPRPGGAASINSLHNPESPQ